ncbi:hypothetical protein LEMLEM_LOCUS8752, partial [Lemmus lemmus]
MDHNNNVPEFVLLDFTQDPTWQKTLSVMFFTHLHCVNGENLVFVGTVIASSSLVS